MTSEPPRGALAARLAARAPLRLALLRAMLADARDRLGLDFGFVLWDGSTVPDAIPAGMLALRFADEGVIAALIRRPRLDTLVNLWVAARIDLSGGTIFDLVARRPKVRSRDMRRALDRGRLLRLAAEFAALPRGGPWPLEGVAEARADGGEATNTANVQYHYDLSNAFYVLFLDPEMVYSCAYYASWDNDLATAQRDKLDMICRKLRLKPGETFLDIGCGWGALVCHAAEHYGATARGLTLSQAQLDGARQKVAERGLADRVTLELSDYARVDGHFDKIASIGMFEHVGLANHDRYFATVHRLLAPGGLYLHHAITRPAKRSARAFRRRRPEYAAILRYIFPGAELDHIGMTHANLERAGFEVHDVEGWREHYQRTCRAWHDRLLDARAAAVDEIGVERTRLWLLYLAGCSIGFERNTLGLFQTLASKRRRGPSSVPPSRADLYAAPPPVDGFKSK